VISQPDLSNVPRLGIPLMAPQRQSEEPVDHRDTFLYSQPKDEISRTVTTGDQLRHGLKRIGHWVFMAGLIANNL
jgi:hypothetical protein